MRNLVARASIVAVAAALITVPASDAAARGVHYRHPRPHPATANPGNGVNYYGGRVISNVAVVAVFWTGAVDPTMQAQIGGFYTTIVKSSFVDWMTEYDTIGVMGQDGQPGSNQHIGRGTYVGAFTITPASASTSLQDTDISAELVAQIQGGALPVPALDEAGNVNTLYMLEFPSGYTISDGTGTSCVDFDGYHNSVDIGGANVPYAVHSDCGDAFEVKTLVHSHELAEAMTDMEVGAATAATPARPLGWDSDDAAQDEVGDLCENNNLSAIVGGYTVQPIWSNFADGCVAGIPICDGSAAPPQCRPCNKYDSGNACTGASAQCDVTSGRCVAATPVVDAGSGSGGSDAGGSGSSGGGSSGGSSGGQSSSGDGGFTSSDGGTAAGDSGAGGGAGDLGGASASGCRVGRDGETDLALLAGVLTVVLASRRRARADRGQS